MNKLLVSITTSIALLAAAPVMAQQTPTTAGNTGGVLTLAQAETQKTNYTDAELKKFISAQEGITEVREEYIEKIEAADSQEKAQELQMQANDEMVSVIEDANMDIPTYNAIATAYSSEPKVRNRIEALM
ncbi:DUF4168 domain-containing protein [Marinobacter piscensis]|uniref:DUF4168 domain-containing protein n=1 Tax=Marinobacter piscensis TaxID=1562308 RepID=UPI0011A28100|nr:DUF4168 domain-containing protein [Marinobacter piscensis]